MCLQQVRGRGCVHAVIVAAVCLHPSPTPHARSYLQTAYPHICTVTEVDKAAVPSPLYTPLPTHPTPPTAVWAVTSCADQLTCKTSRRHGPRFSLNLICLIHVSVCIWCLKTNLLNTTNILFNVFEFNKNIIVPTSHKRWDCEW